MKTSMHAVAIILLVTQSLQAAPPATQPATQPAPELSVRFVSIAKTDKGYKLTVELTNVSGKDIKAIRGGIRFYQGDNQIGNSGAGLDIQELIPAGKSIEKSGTWTLLVGQIGDSLTAAPDQITMKWRTVRVTFAGEK